MDDIIVIIITLIVALVGVFSNKKKKQQASAPPVNEEQESTPDFWDMVMDGGVGEETEVPEFVQKEPYVEKYEEQQVEPSVQMPVREEGVSVIKKQMKENMKEKKKVMIEGEEFSLRKAVIYNEILNRKYT